MSFYFNHLIYKFKSDFSLSKGPLFEEKPKDLDKRLFEV